MTGMDLSGIDLTTEVLRTDRLVLRPFSTDDLDAVLAGCQDPDVQRWINVPVPYTREHARSYVAEESPAERLAGTGTDLAVEADGQVLGSAGVHRIGQHPMGPEIGYW